MTQARIHVDKSELDKQSRLQEQRNEELTDKMFTMLFSLLALGVVSFLVWSFIAD